MNGPSRVAPRECPAVRERPAEELAQSGISSVYGRPNHLSHRGHRNLRTRSRAVKCCPPRILRSCQWHARSYGGLFKTVPGAGLAGVRGPACFTNGFPGPRRSLRLTRACLFGRGPRLDRILTSRQGAAALCGRAVTATAAIAYLRWILSNASSDAPDNWQGTPAVSGHIPWSRTSAITMASSSRTDIRSRNPPMTLRCLFLPGNGA